MLNVFTLGNQGLQRLPRLPGGVIGPETVWIDLIEPAVDEEQLVERTLSVDIPTREEMREIESSNRFYEEKGTLYMTATIVRGFDTEIPETAQVTFIIAGPRLVTNRYVDPQPFRNFIGYAERHPEIAASPALLLSGLLEAIINRIADVIERVGAELDATSTAVFAARASKDASRDYRRVLQQVAQSGVLVSKTRESLVSLGRMLAFVQQVPLAQGADGGNQLTQEVRSRFRTLSRDVLAMSDHVSFVGTKVQFILDATLGLVTINQNDILKIFSVVAVFLLPPTVVASFYGMNFERIPWLQAPWGPWAALGFMAASSLVPYLLFKRRGWL
jgi:magnesium transporter